jgi:hypothetical protein
MSPHTYHTTPTGTDRHGHRQGPGTGTQAHRDTTDRHRMSSFYNTPDNAETPRRCIVPLIVSLL